MLGRLPRVPNENVLVGFETSDDAGVYKLSDTCALVQTADFFTPIVDDPHTFGAIAAANALSDVYAMGGRPISALSLVSYPAKGDLDDLVAILTGGSAKMTEAGCAILGGHSVADDERVHTMRRGLGPRSRTRPIGYAAGSTSRSGVASAGEAVMSSPPEVWGS